MPSAQSKLEILIEAKNQASGPIKEIESSVTGLENILTGVAAGFGVAFGPQLVQQVAGAAVEMSQMAAQSERVGKGFDNLASSMGQSGDAMLSAMHQAAQGTISDNDLMLSANRAMLLGVADSADEMSKLLEVAAARGKLMGESTSQAFSDLVTGIGRMSPMILDNLGITIDAQAAYDQYAQSIGTTADQLSEAQKKQVLLNQIIQDSTTLVDQNKQSIGDTAQAYEQYGTAVTNAKVALGEAFNPAMFVALGLGTQYIQQQTAMLKNEMAALNAAYVATKNFTTGSHELTTAQMQAAEAEGKADDMTRRLTFGLGGLGAAAQEAGHHMRELGADALAAADAFNVAMNLSRDIATTISSTAASAGALFAGKQGGTAGLAKQQEITDELNNQVKAWNEAGYSQKQIDDVLLPGMVNQINDANSALFRATSQTSGLSDEAQAAKQAFDELSGTVEGVLRGALDPGVGVDPSSLLPRQDAINEDARRLADVAVKGFDSPWADYFKTQFPELWQNMIVSGDIKSGAAELLRDFQDGLEPELLDKGKVKDRVRRMLLGDQNMAEMAQEIATELSQEMGVPLQQAMAATQSTLGGGGAGGAAGTSFTDGMVAATTDADTGGSLITTVDTQLRAKFGLLAAAGREAAKTWGDAFLSVVGDNVPPALISLLTDLITPQVMARFTQQQTQVGMAP